MTYLRLVSDTSPSMGALPAKKLYKLTIRFSFLLPHELYAKLRSYGNTQ